MSGYEEITTDKLEQIIYADDKAKKMVEDANKKIAQTEKEANEKIELAKLEVETAKKAAKIAQEEVEKEKKREDAEQKAKQAEEERKKQLENNKETNGQKVLRRATTIVAATADAPLNNLDSVVGGSSYLLFSYGIACLANGDWKSGLSALVVSVFFCAAKYQLPTGKLGKWLRRETKASKAVEKTVENIRKSIIK